MDGLQTRVEAGLDDRDLLARFVDGRDDRAFADLVDRHGRMVLGVCRRILGDSAEADDAFQAVFLILIARAEALHRSPIGNRTLGGWLYRVAANAALQVRRESSARRRRESAFARDREGTRVDDSPIREVLPVLDEEIGRLPDRYRAPLVLCYYQGRSQHDAAEELGISYATLRRRLDRARETLRSRLTRRGCAIAPAGLAGLMAASSAQAARIGPDEVEALAGPLIVGAPGASTRAVAVSRAILRMIRVRMIRRGIGFLLAILLLGSPGLVDQGLAGSEPAVEAKGPARVAAAVAPRSTIDEGFDGPDSPKKATDPDPVAALRIDPPIEKEKAPAIPEVDREILDALKGGTDRAILKGSKSIDSQNRTMPDPGALTNKLPEAPGAARANAADPAPGPAAKARPPENAAIDREIRNAIRRGQQQRRRRVPQMVGPGFNGMWGMWGMRGFGGAGGAWVVGGGMPGFGGAGWMPGFGGGWGGGMGFVGGRRMPAFGGLGGAGGGGMFLRPPGPGPLGAGGDNGGAGGP